MFTQKLSMDCTKQQYEKYLRNELLKMGYNEKDMYWGRNINIFTNVFRGITGYMFDISEDSKEKYERTYLGSFNAPLFLALAAMTDEIGSAYREYYIQGSYMLPMNEKGFLGKNGVWRKATVSEIMAKFGEQQPSIEERLEKIERFIAELPCEKVSEPKYKEPIVGEIIIAWDRNKKDSVIGMFKKIGNHEDYPYVIGISCYRNAIAFESIEQYKEFINA